MQIKEYEQKMHNIAMKEARGEYLKPEEIIFEDGYTQADYSEALSKKLEESGIDVNIYDQLDWSKASF